MLGRNRSGLCVGTCSEKEPPQREILSCSPPSPPLVPDRSPRYTGVPRLRRRRGAGLRGAGIGTPCRTSHSGAGMEATPPPHSAPQPPRGRALPRKAKQRSPRFQLSGPAARRVPGGLPSLHARGFPGKAFLPAPAARTTGRLHTTGPGQGLRGPLPEPLARSAHREPRPRQPGPADQRARRRHPAAPRPRLPKPTTDGTRDDTDARTPPPHFTRLFIIFQGAVAGWRHRPMRSAAALTGDEH